jgi:hypothetical protein
MIFSAARGVKYVNRANNTTVGIKRASTLCYGVIEFVATQRAILPVTPERRAQNCYWVVKQSGFRVESEVGAAKWWCA